MLYAVGDIHGQCRMLRGLSTLFDRLAEGDTVVFLGDYIDGVSGPHGPGDQTPALITSLIGLQRELKKRGITAVFLAGNHEAMFRAAIDEQSAWEPGTGSQLYSPLAKEWFQQGGNSTMTSYARLQGIEWDTSDEEKVREWWTFIPAAHQGFLLSTAIEYRAGGYCFVHAGLLPADQPWTERLARADRDPRQWVFGQFTDSDADHDAVVLFGHTPQWDNRWPLVAANKLGIDTGAGLRREGLLTAVALDPDMYVPEQFRRNAPVRRVFQVDSAGAPLA